MKTTSLMLTGCIALYGMIPAFGGTSSKPKADPNLASISYYTDLCTCTAKFDKTKLDPQRALNSINFQRSMSEHEPHSPLWSEQIKLSPEKLKATLSDYKLESAVFIKSLESIQVLESDEWQKLKTNSLRDARLSEYQKVAELNYLISGDNSYLLKGFEGEELPNNCKAIAEVLKMPVKDRQKLLQILKPGTANNKHPNEAHEKLNQKDLNELRNEVLNFGWHKCTNDHWRTKENSLYDDNFLKLEKQFVSKKCQCDEP